MEFTKQEQEMIVKMINKGERFNRIAEKLGGHCSWQDIQTFCWQAKQMSWQGSKNMIARRLKRLELAGQKQERVKLVTEIDDRVNYLYNCAKEMKARLDEVEKFMKKFSDV